MSSKKYVIGAGTKIYVAPLPECDRVPPDQLTFQTDVDTAGGAETLPVIVTVRARDGSPLPDGDTTTPTLPIYPPFWLNFIEPNGLEHFVKINDIFNPDDAELTISALKKRIPAGSKAIFPVRLRSRTSASLSNNDSTQEFTTFDDDGEKDSITTALGYGFECPGHYNPLDAGWNICAETRLRKGELWWELHLPKPGCTDDYKRGHIFSGFGGVQVPIEAPADNVITSNITIGVRGKVYKLDPE